MRGPSLRQSRFQGVAVRPSSKQVLCVSHWPIDRVRRDRYHSPEAIGRNYVRCRRDSNLQRLDISNVLTQVLPGLSLGRALQPAHTGRKVRADELNTSRDNSPLHSGKLVFEGRDASRRQRSDCLATHDLLHGGFVAQIGSELEVLLDGSSLIRELPRGRDAVKNSRSFGNLAEERLAGFGILWIHVFSQG